MEPYVQHPMTDMEPGHRQVEKDLPCHFHGEEEQIEKRDDEVEESSGQEDNGQQDLQVPGEMSSSEHQEGSADAVADAIGTRAVPDGTQENVELYDSAEETGQSGGTPEKTEEAASYEEKADEQYSGQERIDEPYSGQERANATGTNTSEVTPAVDATPGVNVMDVSTETPSTAPVRSSTPKSLKDRLSEIPARLSRFSLLNALRSGTYVVSENKSMSDAEADKEMANEAEDESKAIMDDTNQEVTLTRLDQVSSELPPQVSQNKKKHSVHRSALTKLLCSLYALLLVVFGIVFAVASSLTVKERQHLYYLEVYLTYLYTGSLAVLVYFQFCILRGVKVRNNYFDNSIRVVIRRSQDNLQLSPSPTRKQDNEHSINIDNSGTFDFRKEPLDQTSTLSTRSHLIAPADGEVAHVGEGINFYLRLGALAFSIGSVTLDGFHIASYFETESTATCESYIFPVVYVLHLIFTFIQTFFLFKNHKLVIAKNKASVRFGLMHLLATNLAVWFVIAITETAEDYRQQDYVASLTDNRTEVRNLKSCYEDITLARTASPYLFPCTIIYSIIAAGILYRMYQYVGVKVSQRWPSHTSLTSSLPHGAVGMDCEKANKGLFTGLLIAVITLIAIATFFVFESRLNHPQTAIKVFYVMEISLVIITGSCILFGMLSFARLRFLENYLSLDSVLLIISLGGAYIYLSFMLISSASMVDKHGDISILSLAAICVGILESTLQAVYILDGLCRRADSDSQVEAKPGRSVVTFLLVCNLALWVVSMFEIKKTMVVPFHLEFYGILPWNIMLHLCVPLFIYYRFHSAICLSKIWYNAYQKERSPAYN